MKTDYERDKEKDFQNRKAILIRYLVMKTNEEDWHAVADAAMDLRELEVEIRIGRK